MQSKNSVALSGNGQHLLNAPVGIRCMWEQVGNIKVANDDMVVLDTAEVAQLLRTTRGTIYEMARAGSIPCRKVGRAYRFERLAVLEWLRAKNARPRAGDRHERA